MQSCVGGIEPGPKLWLAYILGRRRLLVATNIFLHLNRLDRTIDQARLAFSW